MRWILKFVNNAGMLALTTSSSLDEKKAENRL